jgi:NAD(P)H-flavin reductase
VQPPAPRSLTVEVVEPVGAYTLIRLRNDGAPVGVPGQFCMLRAEPEPADAYLGRALSPALADERSLTFLLDVRGAGTAALARADRVVVTGPLGRGFTPAPGRAIVVSGGIGAAALPWLVSELRRDPGRPVTTLLGFRDEAAAVCAALVDPDAEVVLDPVLVTEPLHRMLPAAGATVYACGPDPMLRAVAALCAEYELPCQLAMEAAMACGFGACFGCAVHLDGEWKRLCIEGPVVEAARVLA